MFAAQELKKSYYNLSDEIKTIYFIALNTKECSELRKFPIGNKRGEGKLQYCRNQVIIWNRTYLEAEKYGNGKCENEEND